MKRFIFLICLGTLLLSGIFLRVFLFLYNPSSNIYQDTYGYLRYANLLNSDPSKYFINDTRMPLYPLFLIVSAKVAGAETIDYDVTGNSLKTVAAAAFLQQYIGFLSILFFTIILKRTFFSSKAALLTFFVLTFSLPLVNWERIALSESLSIDTMMILLSFILLFLRQKRMVWVFGILASLLLLFLNRPFYFLLPLPLSLLLFLKVGSKMGKIGSLFIFIFFLALTIASIFHNAVTFSYSGLSRISDINMLGKIMAYEIPIEAGKEYTVYENLKAFEKQPDYQKNPYRFIDFYREKNQSEPEKYLDELQPFTKKVILAHLPYFVYKNLTEIIPLSTEDNALTTPNTPSSPYHIFFSILYIPGRMIQFLFPLVLVAFPIHFILSIKNNEPKNTFFLTLGAIGFYQIVVSVFFSYEAYGRLISPAYPAIYMYLGWMLIRLAKKILFLRKYPSITPHN